MIKLFPYGWTCVLHFIVVEMRSLYLFYMSVKSFTAKIAISAEMDRQMNSKVGTEDWQHICIHDPQLQGLLECVTAGVQEALWSFWISEDTIDGCYREDKPGFSYIGALHLSALAVCCVFMLACLLLLVMSDASDWRAGNYLYFTWDLEHRTRYRFFAYVLVTYTALFLAYVILAAYEIIPTMHLFIPADELLPLAGADMVGILMGSVAFLGTTDPPFNWEEAQLMTCVFFGRPWYNVVQATNDSFGKKLEHAILKARLKMPHELEQCLGYEYDGPLTIESSGGHHMSDECRRVFIALGAIDAEPRELKPVVDMESLEMRSSRPSFCCRPSKPSHKAQEQHALLSGE